MWRVIPEPVVVQPCFPIFVLSLETERYEVSLTSEFQHISIDVKDTVPNYLTLAAKSLYRRTQVVLHDGITALLGEFRHRGITSTVIHPCNEIGVRLLSVIADATEFIFLHSRLFPPVIAPLMQQHVSVTSIEERPLSLIVVTPY